MKMLLRAKMPNEPFNSLVKSGAAGKKIQAILADVKAEAVYFTEMDGMRGCIMIVDVASPSQVPALAEPFFITFNAEVSFHIVMSPEDLGKAGLDDIAKKWA
jgi:hypothetical protein